MMLTAPILRWKAGVRKEKAAFPAVIVGTIPRIIFTASTAIVLIVMSVTGAARVVRSWYAIPAGRAAGPAITVCVRGVMRIIAKTVVVRCASPVRKRWVVITVVARYVRTVYRNVSDVVPRIVNLVLQLR
jgi:hypothetical protein